MYQQMMLALRKHCFDKCIVKPSANLTEKEISCLSNCTDRYIGAKI